MPDSVWMASGWTMIHFLWVGCVIGAAVALAMRSTRGACADVRYAVALVGFVVLAAAPAVIFAAVHEPVAAMSFDGLVDDVEAAGEPAAADELQDDDSASAAITFADGAFEVDGLVGMIPWLWIVGATTTFGWLGLGLFGVGRLARRSEPVTDPAVVALVERALAALRITRRVVVATCGAVASPVVVGIVKPVILVPPGLVLGLSVEQLEMVILHELAHVRRWDNLINLVQRIVCSALFFHPVTWWLSRRVRREREHCCDAFVVARTGRPRAYARTLLELASPRPTSAPLAAMAGEDVVERVRKILDVREPETMTWTHRLSGVLATATCLLALMLTVAGQEPPTTQRIAGFDPALAPQEKPKKGAHENFYPGVKKPSENPHVNLKANDCKNCHAPSPGLAELARRVALDHVHNTSAKCTDCHVVPKTGNWPFDIYDEPVKAKAKTGRRWGPEQATGKPNTPVAGDRPTAWASLTEDGQDEWLELTWKKAVSPVSINIYNSFNPGAVCRVWAWNSQGKRIKIWEGRDDGPEGAKSWVSVIPMKKGFATKRVRIELASKRVKGWNEIDAVGLVDRAGTTHWATTAKASSTYATVAANPTVGRYVIPVTRPMQGAGYPATLEKQLAKTREDLERALKKLAELEKKLAEKERRRKN